MRETHQNKKAPARAGLVVFYNPYEAGGSAAGQVLEDSLTLLRDAQFSSLAAPVMVHDIATARQAAKFFLDADVAVIIIHLATWTGDDLLIEFYQAAEAGSSCVFLVLWALRDINSGSLCCAHQFNMVLCELGFSVGEVIIGKDSTAIECLNTAVTRLGERVSASNRCLRPTPRDTRWETVRAMSESLLRVRVGMIGARTPGMMEVAFDEFGIKAELGVTVDSIPVAELERRVMEKPSNVVHEAMLAVKQKFKGIEITVDPASIEVATRNYLALKDLVKERYLDAITIDCYPGYMGKTCLAFSILADEGIACACEADVHAAVLIWLVQRLSNRPANHIDTLDVDPAQNTVTGGHCGACSLQLARPGSAVIAPVRLSNGGACIVFPQKEGPVTLVNLVGRSGTFRACVITGTAVEEGLVFPGNPVTIKIDVPVDEFLATVAREGLGHHWIVGQGTHYAPILVDLFRVHGIKVSMVRR